MIPFKEIVDKSRANSLALRRPINSRREATTLKDFLQTKCEKARVIYTGLATTNIYYYCRAQ